MAVKPAEHKTMLSGQIFEVGYLMVLDGTFEAWEEVVLY